MILSLGRPALYGRAFERRRGKSCGRRYRDRRPRPAGGWRGGCGAARASPDPSRAAFPPAFRRRITGHRRRPGRDDGAGVSGVGGCAGGRRSPRRWRGNLAVGVCCGGVPLVPYRRVGGLARILPPGPGGPPRFQVPPAPLPCGLLSSNPAAAASRSNQETNSWMRVMLFQRWEICHS
ncbi:Wilms tumor protein 1-interacting protein-like [Pogoniulus pusillus]|uniref:Wilms tumor protein 1-interacting protein-like n=1 Tax=Pogoniulus pusillus TaxID=488313 RepID=UPI0030B99136